jgi:N6-L-threonylcarbamoyladenine synthase
MIILGIESSCDETGIAIVRDGTDILSNVISSQVDLHAQYGGIIPELASRQHMLSIGPVFRQACTDAKITTSGIDMVAATTGPGLAGALIIGTNFAKGLSLGLGVPFRSINHMEGHIYAAWLNKQDGPDKEFGFPIICLLASGGHTELILMSDHGSYKRLGETRDDAAGEAFDKGARILGLGFPGGPAIQAEALKSQAPEKLPRAWLGDSLEFSFSGVKSATLRRAQELGIDKLSISGLPADALLFSEARANLAAGLQNSIVDVLVKKTILAAKSNQARCIIIGGGVAANSHLRQEIASVSPIPVIAPLPSLCTDNGAMIAGAAFFSKGTQNDSLAADAIPNLRL